MNEEKKASENGEDDVLGTFEEHTILSKGTYEATLVDVYPEESEDEDYSDQYVWCFAVRHEDGTEQINGWTSQTISDRSKAGRWIDALTDHPWEEGMKVRKSELEGSDCLVSVSVKKSAAGNEYNRIDDVMPQPKPSNQSEGAV